jgi:hypothetical protein
VAAWIELQECAAPTVKLRLAAIGQGVEIGSAALHSKGSGWRLHHGGSG